MDMAWWLLFNFNVVRMCYKVSGVPFSLLLAGCPVLSCSREALTWPGTNVPLTSKDLRSANSHDWGSLEADCSVAEPWSDCNPGRHLNCCLKREILGEAQALGKLCQDTWSPGTGLLTCCCLKPLSVGWIHYATARRDSRGEGSVIGRFYLLA